MGRNHVPRPLFRPGPAHISLRYARDVAIADVLRDAGDVRGALDKFQKSLEIREKLAAADPERPEWQRNIALSLGRVAMLLARKGCVGEAAAGFQMGRDIIASLRQRFPDSATLPKELAWFDAQLAALKD